MSPKPIEIRRETLVKNGSVIERVHLMPGESWPQLCTIEERYVRRWAMEGILCRQGSDKLLLTLSDTHALYRIVVEDLRGVTLELVGAS